MQKSGMSDISLPPLPCASETGSQDGSGGEEEENEETKTEVPLVHEIEFSTSIVEQILELGILDFLGTFDLSVGAPILKSIMRLDRD